MDQEKANQAKRESAVAAIAALSKQLIEDDWINGPLKEIIYDHIDLPSEAMPFIKGVQLGASYAISMIMTGKLDLTLLEFENTNQGSEQARQGVSPADSE